MKKIFLSLMLALGIASTFYQLSEAHFGYGRYRGNRGGCCPRYNRGGCCPGFYRGGWGFGRGGYRGGWGFFGRGARYNHGGYYRGHGHHGHAGHHGNFHSGREVVGHRGHGHQMAETEATQETMAETETVE